MLLKILVFWENTTAFGLLVEPDVKPNNVLFGLIIGKILNLPYLEPNK